MATAPHAQQFTPSALSMVDELVALGDRAVNEGGRCDTYFTLATAILDSYEAGDDDLARQWIDGAVAWLGHAS